MDWHVEFLDVDGDILMEEPFIGFSAPALSRALARRFDYDFDLADVAGWNVHAIPVDD